MVVKNLNTLLLKNHRSGFALSRILIFLVITFNLCIMVILLDSESLATFSEIAQKKRRKTYFLCTFWNVKNAKRKKNRNFST